MGPEQTARLSPGAATMIKAQTKNLTNLLDGLPWFYVCEGVDEDPGLEYLVRVLGPVPVLYVPLTQPDHVVNGVTPHL